MKTNSIYILLILLSINGTSFAALSEKEYLAEITELAAKEENDELQKKAGEFFKNYPGSNLIADVRLILADKETDPEKAAEQYKILVDKYRYFKERSLAQYRICEIYYLMSKWQTLEHESIKGIRLFNDSEYSTEFRFFLAKTYIHLERYDKAKEICIEITERDHNYRALSGALILLAYINRNIYGLSRSYLHSLSELISGFRDSENMPAALFLLGRYYQAKHEYNKAFSAYSDVIRDFPGSPEAAFSRQQLDTIMKFNPVKTAYLPDKASIRKTDQIDIQPEVDIDPFTESVTDETLYSISLGPFFSISNARKIEKLIKDDFQPVEIAQTRTGYMIYSGRFRTIDSAVSMKIRLAEEYGMNGTIVKMIKDVKRLYIYEE
jgi:tetratricopeptide (TPR) repeat protein